MVGYRTLTNGKKAILIAGLISIASAAVGGAAKVAEVIFTTGRLVQKQSDLLNRLSWHVCRIEEQSKLQSFKDCLADITGTSHEYDGR